MHKGELEQRYKSLVRYAEISSTGFQTHFSSA